MVSSSLQSAQLDASPSERNSIRILKVLGWIYLTVSVLIALVLLLLMQATANQVSQMPGLSSFSSAAMIEGIVVAIILIIFGAGSWAMFHVGASIAESLIMIRKNTA
jgi:hypothetical protein